MLMCPGTGLEFQAAAFVKNIVKPNPVSQEQQRRSRAPSPRLHHPHEEPSRRALSGCVSPDGLPPALANGPVRHVHRASVSRDRAGSPTVPAAVAKAELANCSWRTPPPTVMQLLAQHQRLVFSVYVLGAAASLRRLEDLRRTHVLHRPSPQARAACGRDV